MAMERAIDRRSAPQLRLIEGRVRRTEEREAWGRVLVLSDHIHRLVPTFDNGPIREVEQRSAELNHIAARRLRQLGGSDDAA
jgi:hypothetical protein